MSLDNVSKIIYITLLEQCSSQQYMQYRSSNETQLEHTCFKVTKMFIWSLKTLSSYLLLKLLRNEAPISYFLCMKNNSSVL